MTGTVTQLRTRRWATVGWEAGKYRVIIRSPHTQLADARLRTEQDVLAMLRVWGVQRREDVVELEPVP